MSTVEYFANQSSVNLAKFKVKEVHPSSVTAKEISTSATALVPDNVWATGAPILWNLGFTGVGCKIGVLDTGIDSHPDLLNKIILRRDYVQDGLPSSSFNMHATHCSGTIAANGRIKGVAPGASLIDYRVLDRNGSGSYTSITSAIKQSIVDGCNIISLSLGGPIEYLPLHSAIKEATAAGILVVVASGNEGPNKISFPAYYSEVVSVGAVNFDATTGNITLPQTPWFSNSNDQVDVAADGWKVLSTVPGGKYAILTGTSMATPCVAGFAALLWERFSAKMKRKPTEPELYSLLKSSTVDILQVGNDIVAGAGFVTVFPELPKKVNSTWTLPNMNLTPPYTGTSVAATVVNTASVESTVNATTESTEASNIVEILATVSLEVSATENVDNVNVDNEATKETETNESQAVTENQDDGVCLLQK